MLFHKDKIDWIPQRYISVVMKPGDPSELVSQIGEICRYFAQILKSTMNQQEISSKYYLH